VCVGARRVAKLPILSHEAVSLLWPRAHLMMMDPFSRRCARNKTAIRGPVRETGCC
jgi:hypothetical protein